MTPAASPRGFALLIAVVLTSVLLSVGLALLDIAYKQITLSSTARQSQYAFYAADSALECALYWDQQEAAFEYGNEASHIVCGDITIPVSPGPFASNVRKSEFSIPCPGGTQATVTVYKTNGLASCSGADNNSCLLASGYNTCNTADPRRIERGLKVVY